MHSSSKIVAIAAVCHAVNAAYCRSLGDESQKSWLEAPEWQRNSAIAGVQFIIDNPDSTPADQHASWLAVKEADGWVYGEVKDEEAKTHPCMVPYDDLPPEQREGLSTQFEQRLGERLGVELLAHAFAAVSSSSITS